MPEMDGLAFVRAARAAGHEGLRLVMLTGQADQAQAARAAGADDFLVKPPNREALRATLQRLALVQG
jgi:CheY-like chemotaxis protein